MKWNEKRRAIYEMNITVISYLGVTMCLESVVEDNSALKSCDHQHLRLYHPDQLLRCIKRYQYFCLEFYRDRK